VAVNLEGKVFVDKEPVELSQMVERIREKVSKDKKTVVYLAIAEGQGTMDRAPLLQELWDRMRPLNMTVNLVGRPGLAAANQPTAPAGTGAPKP
jgi:hypothetical protein